MGCEGCSVKCEDGVRLALRWHVVARMSCACTHGPGWHTVRASSIDEKGLIIKSKATSAPPRAGTTGSPSNSICHFGLPKLNNMCISNLMMMMMMTMTPRI